MADLLDLDPVNEDGDALPVEFVVVFLLMGFITLCDCDNGEDGWCCCCFFDAPDPISLIEAVFVVFCAFIVVFAFFVLGGDPLVEDVVGDDVVDDDAFAFVAVVVKMIGDEEPTNGDPVRFDVLILLASFLSFCLVPFFVELSLSLAVAREDDDLVFDILPDAMVFFFFGLVNTIASSSESSVLASSAMDLNEPPLAAPLLEQEEAPF